MKVLVVEKNKLTGNIEKIKKRAQKSNTEVIAMIKGNGYGLGLCEFAQCLCDNGIKFLAVSTLQEALKLAECKLSAQIMLLSPLYSVEDARLAADNDIIMTISSPESAMAADVVSKEKNKTLKIQLAIDTGFGRFGFLYNNISEAATTVLSLEKCEIVGCFSHFSDAFSDKKEHTQMQFDRFCAAIKDLNARGIDIKMRHICNSSAFLKYDNMHLDAVRIGSAFLGRVLVENKLNLSKIAYLESEICEIKTLPSGYNIGYANTYKTKKETKIAVIPVGYMDGFGVVKKDDTYRFFDCLRYIYHNVCSIFKDMKTYVKIKNEKCPVLGRISMFNIVADVSGKEVFCGDKVVLECNPILINSSVLREYR